MNREHGLARNLQFGGAILLVNVYVQNVLMTLSAMRLQRDEHGLWQVLVDGAHVNKLWVVLGLLMLVLGGLAFLAGYLFKRRRGSRNPERGRLTMRDMFMSFGWVGLLFFGGVFFYEIGWLRLLIPAGLRESAAGSALGGVSMQIAAILVIPLYFRRSFHEIGLKRPVITWKMLGLVLMFFTMTYAMSLVSNWLGGWLGIDTNSYREQSISNELQSAVKTGWLLTSAPLLATAVIAPIGEEFLFRGVLQSVLTARLGAWVGVIGSAFLFALIHADLVLFVPIFLMGLLFAWIYRMTGSLWAPIWLHILNNLFASLLDLL
jgi:uncharacterized protein